MLGEECSRAWLGGAKVYQEISTKALGIVAGAPGGVIV